MCPYALQPGGPNVAILLKPCSSVTGASRGKMASSDLYLCNQCRGRAFKKSVFPSFCKMPCPSLFVFLLGVMGVADTNGEVHLGRSDICLQPANTLAFL